MSSLKNGINCTYTEETDENSNYLYHCNISILKTQGSPRDNLENYYWEKTSQNETINCPSKNIHPFLKMIFNF